MASNKHTPNQTKDFSNATDLSDVSEVLKSLGKIIRHEMANAIMTEEFKSNVAEKIHLRKESSDDGYVKIDDLQKALMHIKTGNPQQSAIQSNATIIAESFTNLKKQLVKVETRLEAMEDHLFNLEQRSYDRKKALIQQIVKTAVKKIDKKDTKDVSTQVNFPSREYDTIVILEPPIGDTFIISDGTSSSSSSTLSFEEATLIETDMTLSDCYRAMNKFNKHMLRKSISEGGLV